MIKHIRIKEGKRISSTEDGFSISIPTTTTNTTGDSSDNHVYYLLYRGNDFAMPIFWARDEYGKIVVKTNETEYDYAPTKYGIECFIKVTYKEIRDFHYRGYTVHTNKVPYIVKEYLEELNGIRYEELRVKT